MRNSSPMQGSPKCEIIATVPFKVLVRVKFAVLHNFSFFKAVGKFFR